MIFRIAKQDNRKKNWRGSGWSQCND